MQLTYISAERALTKSYVKGESRSFQHQKELTSHVEHVTDIKEFYESIKKHALQGHALMKGHFDRPLVNEPRAGRSAPALTTSWFMLDIDGIDDIEKIDDLFADIPEIANASYILQYSASYKIKNDKLNAHLFFLLDEAISPRKLKSYLKSLNLRPGIKARLRLNEARSAIKYLIDPTVADESRIIYIAPPLSDKKLPLAKDQYIQLVLKERETVSLPSFNPGSIDDQLHEIRDALRKAEGLKPKKAMRLESDANGQSYELDTSPDTVKIYIKNVSVHSGWVTCNVNDGDSGAYYFPISRITQQTIMRNWKNEPYFYIAKADPEFQKEWNNTTLPALIAENPELGKSLPEDINHDLIGLPDNENHFVAFDIQESAYKVIRFEPQQRQLEITRHELEKLNNYCMTAGIDFPEIRPIYRFITDVSSDSETPIDHIKREVNSWILPPLLDRKCLPMPEDIPIRSLSIADVIDMIKTECPLIWSQVSSALNHDIDETLPLFLNWFSIAMYDRIKLRTAWILQGTQGTGKSFITQNLARALLNNDADAAPNLSLDILREQFNAWAEKALFVEWEESSTNKTIRDIKLIDDIKRLITGKETSIRKMRTDAYQQRIHFNMVFTTNHNAPFQFDEADRRFFVAPKQTRKWEHQMIDEIGKEQLEDWDLNFDKVLQEELPKFSVAMLLLKTDITKANQVIMNKAKQDMIEGSKTAGQGLLDAIIRGDIGWIMEGLEDEPTDPNQQINISTSRNILAMATEFFLTENAEKSQGFPLKWSEISVLHAAINGEKFPLSTKRIKAFALNQGLDEEKMRRGEQIIRGLKIHLTPNTRQYIAKMRGRNGFKP